MILVELVYNLSLLVALSIVSGFLDKRYNRTTLKGLILQGILFGFVAIIGMTRSLIYSEGLIFDGRSVIISLSTLFLGPITGSIAALMAIVFRVIQSGSGTVTGTLVIISALFIGAIFHFWKKKRNEEITFLQLLLLGIGVHIVMLLLMFSLPFQTAVSVIQRIGISVILCYPLATVLIGKILSDQENNIRVNQQIQTSELKYSSFFENSLDAMLLTIPNVKILSANPAACKMFGYSENDFITLDRSSVVDETDPRLSLLLLDRVMNGSAKGELTFIRQNGTQFFTEISTAIFKNHVGLERASLIIRDITERKKAEQALSASEHLFHTLAQNSPDGIFKTDPDGYTTYVNPKWSQLSGLPMIEALGYGWMSAVHPDDKIIVLKEWKESVKIQKTSFLEYRFMHSDGKIVWVMGQATPETNSLNQFIGYIGTITDITKRKLDEESLTNSETRYRRLFESAKDGILILDAESGKIVDVNPFLIELLGYSKEKFIEKEIWEIGFFKDIAANQDKFLELQKKEYVRYENLPLETTDGKKINVEFVSNVYLVNHHKVIQCNIRDITERKQNEKKLREKEVQYHNLANSGMALIWTSGVDKLCNYFNEPWLRFTGRTLEQEIGNGWTDGVHPDDFDFCLQTYVDAFEQRKPFEMQYRLRHISGEYRWLRDMGTPNYNSSQEFLGYIGHCFDITEHKQIVDALQESEERFRNLYENAQVGMYRTTPDGQILLANKALIKMLGYTSGEELYKRNLEQIGFEPTYQRKQFISQIEKKGEIKDLETKWNKKDGSLIIVKECAKAIRDSKGKTIYYDGTVEDITERKQSESELEKYRNHLEELVRERTQELNEANESLNIEIGKEKEFELMLKHTLEKEKEVSEMKSRFISTTSHEFRTPLTSILSSTEMLQKYGVKWTEDKKSDHLARIKNSVGYLTKLLDDILTISRVETGKLSFNPELINLFQLARECADDAGALMTKMHELKLNYASEQKEFRLDLKLMKFIFNNLLSNAAKYSPNGGTVQLTIITDKENLKLEISDEGIGIPEEEIEKIFESFYRTKNADPIKGTGLGLAIVKRAVDLHNGDIAVTSELGKGTTFKVSIPIMN